MSLPLEDITVLDLSRLVPGAYCTMLLSDLGAKVIKIEEPTRGDYARWLPPFIGEESYGFLLLNRNKNSMTLNLKAERGREIFHRLAKTSDVILESFRPGVVQRLGIDYDTIRNMNPELVYCSITGYGQDGPHRNQPGHDINYMGMGGVLGITLDRHGSPVVPGVQVADTGGALFAVVSILAALIAREATGVGQYIDVSMLDVVISLLSFRFAWYFAKRRPPKTEEIISSGALPYYKVYQTRDGKFIALGAAEGDFWRKLCTKIGREDLIEYQFAKAEKREEISSFLKDLFLTKARDEWSDLLKDVCCSPIYTFDEVFSDPQVVHRKMLREITHHAAGAIKQIRFPSKFSAMALEVQSAPPLFGQHTVEILERLGYTQEEIKNFKESNII